MAVIQYTGLVNQIRGKVNGSVLNKSRTVNTVQKKQQPPKGNRGFQQESRQDFSIGQRTWKELTPVEQTSWQQAADNNPSRDRFGNQVILSGYNQWLKAYMLGRYANWIISRSAYTAPAPAGDMDIYAIYNQEFFVNDEGGVSVNAYIEDYFYTDTPDYGITFDISLPVSAGVTSYHGRWVSVYGEAAPVGWNSNRPVNLGRYYPLPIAGQRVLWRARLIHFQTGAVVATQFGNLEDWVVRPVIESFVMNPSSGVPPYISEITFSNFDSIDGVAYTVKVFYHQSVGLCPTSDIISTETAAWADQILMYKNFGVAEGVPTGSCLGIKVQLIRLHDNAVVQESIAYVSNL